MNTGPDRNKETPPSRKEVAGGLQKTTHQMDLERYRSVMENIPAITYAATIEPGVQLRYVYIHSGLEDLPGCSPEVWKNQPEKRNESIHPHDRFRIREAIEQAHKDNGKFYCEYRIATEAGRYIWIADYGSLVFGENQEPLWIQGLMVDITSRKETEKKLEKSEKKFELLVQNIHEYIYSEKYRDGKYKSSYHSPRSVEITGYTPDEYYSSPNLWSQMIHEQDRVAVSDFFEKLKKTGGIDSIEHRIYHKDGSIRWVWNTSSIQMDGRSQVKRMDGFIVDITERKEMEIRLEKAIQEAREANSIKSRFFAAMSHDIRTPMHGLLGMIDLILDTETTPEQKNYLEMMRSSGENLLHLLNDILDFSRFEAGKIEITKGRFQFRLFVESVLQPFRVQANKKGLVLESMIDPGIPDEIIGDDHRIARILMNLVNNAVKFTDEGRIILDIKKNSSDEILFIISDTGIGVPHDKRQSIFETYGQIDYTLSRKHGGTGLGTTIARQLVELMGGQIGVESPGLLESDESPGSDFWFTLPLETSETKEALRSSRQPPGDVHLKTDHKEQTEKGEPSSLTKTAPGIRILVAEDNRINQMIMVKILTRMGHSVELVEDGLQALEKVSGKDYDLILMDIQMPVLDGLQATKRIREELASQIPVYAVTASANRDELVDLCRKYGLNGFIVKPFKKEELNQVINSVREQSVNLDQSCDFSTRKV